MENKEEVLEALDEFSKHPTGKISSLLEQYLCRIASTGVTVFPWSKLKPLLIHKLDAVVQDFQLRCPMSLQSPSPNVEHVAFDVMRKRLIDDINQFNGIPFTIQRLCELVTNPTKHYQKTDKYMRGVEKNLVVVTTVDPYGNRIVNENKVEINGVKIGGGYDRICQPDALVSSFLPPVPLSSSATSTTNSWFSSLSNVVDSPSSYPNWSSQDTLSDGGLEDGTPADDTDSLEPPRKMPRLESADDAISALDGAGTDSLPAADAGGEEQKTIAPLLTQLLSTSGTAEQIVPPSAERDESTEDADGNGVSHLEKVHPEPIGQSDDFSEAAGDVGEHRLESVVTADDTCDSTNAFSNFLSDGNAARQLSAENQFSHFEVKDDSLSTADSSGLQESRYNYDMEMTENCDEQRSADSDVAQLLPSSEWSGLSDGSGGGGSNVDSVSNEGSECGVDSLLETSDANVSLCDAESCDFGDGACQTVDKESRECEPTSEAQATPNDSCCISNVLSSESGLERDKNELEQVGSSLWISTTMSPMDTD